MTVTLTYTIRPGEDGDDEQDVRNALDGWKWHLISQEMDGYLRGQIKYGTLPEDVDKALQAARDHLNQEIGTRGLSLDE